MKKQPQVRERTREKMFDAFFKEYKENTLRGVTVGAVSRRAVSYTHLDVYKRQPFHGGNQPVYGGTDEGR